MERELQLSLVPMAGGKEMKGIMKKSTLSCQLFLCHEADKGANTLLEIGREDGWCFRISTS